MDVHLHAARGFLGWVLGIGLLAPLPLLLAQGGSAPKEQLSPVTGRVTHRGKPICGMILCIDSGDAHRAYGALRSDGSFSLETQSPGEGVVSGKYRAHLYSMLPEPSRPLLSPKYSAAATSDLELEIVPGWNHFHVDLR